VDFGVVSLLTRQSSNATAIDQFDPNGMICQQGCVLCLLHILVRARCHSPLPCGVGIVARFPTWYWFPESFYDFQLSCTSLFSPRQ